MSRASLVSNGVVQTGEKELSLYVLRNRDFPTCHFERMTLRLDGFVSASAGYGGGELTTPPLVFDGDELELNYSTSAAGHVSVEVQDAAGAPQNGLSLADCGEIIGDETEGVVRWGRRWRPRRAVRQARQAALRAERRGHLRLPLPQTRRVAVDGAAW